MKRLRVLLVKPVLPYPPDQGTRVVSFALLDALRASCDVTVLARRIETGEQASVAALEALGVRVVVVVPGNRRDPVRRAAYKLAYHARSLASGRSLKSLYDCPGVLIRAARELARENFDVVIVEYWQMYPLLHVFPENRTVLLTHDIDRVVNHQRALLEPSAWKRARALRRWRQEEREEVAAYRAATRVLALTPRDAESVRALAGPGTTVSVLPFGLPESAFAAPLAARNSRNLLFLGAMGAAFNRDAIVYFVRDIHPHLADIPGLTVSVVGGALPAAVASFAERPGVEVPGHTRDITPFLARAAALVVPLRYAGGLRIRILEALAAGLPVVATPQAVAGLDVEPGKHLMVAETPAGFRDAVQRILDEPGFAASLAREGRDLAWERYGPRARAEGIRACLEGLADDARGPREGA